MIVQKLKVLGKGFSRLPCYWQLLTILLGLYASLKTYQNLNNARIKHRRLQAGKRRKLEADTAKRSLLNKLKVLCAADSSLEEKWASIVSLNIQTLLGKLRDGELSPVQVLHAYQYKAMEATEATNCVTEPIAEAEQWASELEQSEHRGPLYGLPISVKENFYIKGYASTNGQAKFLEQGVAGSDGVLVAALRKLGAVPFVRTNVPQTLISYDCSNPIYGQTRNPVDPGRTPGGSSGGEAALIGLNGSILGLGSDIAGSLRLPAHCSGISSLKPTSLRVSARCGNPSVPGVQGIKAAYGFMGRDVDSLVTGMRALLTDAMFNEDPNVPPLTFDDSLYENKKLLRIGYYDDDGFYTPTPGVQRAVHEARGILEAAGHDLVRVAHVPGQRAYSIALSCLGGDGGRTLTDILRGEPIDPTLHEFHSAVSTPRWRRLLASQILRVLWPRVALVMRCGAGSGSVHQMMKVYADRNTYVDEVLDMWRELGLDAVICPPMAIPAPPIGTPAGMPVAASYTIIYNMLDFPAGVVPVTSESGEDQSTVGGVDLPIGVQCVSTPWREEVCLRVMRDIETGVRSRTINQQTPKSP